MHQLPTLPYAYDGLAPYVSQDIMELHHKKHHQTYVDKLNEALQGAPEEFQQLPVDQLLEQLDELPEDIRQAVRNNGGGHYNHSAFWQMLTPEGAGRPSGELLKALEQKYGSFKAFKTAFNEQATALFGSGWVWLSPDLAITSTPNQDNPLMKGESAPILGLDVWEHAYYLDYKNVRPDYIDAWWQIVNWAEVEQRFLRLQD